MLAGAAADRAGAVSVDPPEATDYYEVLGLVTAGRGDGPAVEIDPREVPWSTLRRLALLGGAFLPPYQPISAGEITRTLVGSRAAGSAATASLAERRAAARLLARYGLGTDLWAVQTCECKRHPLHGRLEGRLGVTWLGVGDRLPGEAGLGAGAGLSLDVSPAVTLWSGAWWVTAAPRLSGRAVRLPGPADPLLGYRNWPVATTLPGRGDLRLGDPPWVIGWPRAITGLAPGRWSLSAGWSPVAIGPGLDGGLTASLSAPAYPAFTVRRTAGFAWAGLLRHVAPSHLLLRLGVTSRQRVEYREDGSRRAYRTRPVLTQGVVTWNHTPWLRTTLTHAAMAAPRQGESLWPDLPQVVLPTPGVTWTETRSGPVTDRVVTVAVEARFRRAPWPLLPAAAGRVWVEYGGEDINPHDWLPFPQLSAPAAVLGCELVDPRWDLAAQYTETRHPDVLWYTNSGFAEGFSQDGWVLGLPQGGAAETWQGVARRRLHDGDHELQVDLRRTVWQMPGHLPGDARRTALEVTWRRFLGVSRWELTVGGVREDVHLDSGEHTTDDHVAVRAVVTR